MVSQVAIKKVFMIFTFPLLARENVACEFNLPPAPVIYPARVAGRCQLALFFDHSPG